MELSLKYAYTVWEKKSFSAAAKSLFVSQPALSATIAKLEKEIGFKIFNRSTNPITLTEQGKIYINFLNEVSEKEILLQQQLRALNENTCETLTVRGRMFAAQYILPFICGDFYKKHPNINITIDMSSINEKSHTENMDIMFSYIPDAAGQESIPLLEERLVFAIHEDHPAAAPLKKFAVPYEQIISKNIPFQNEVEDTTIFENVPFIETGRLSDVDSRLNQIVKLHKVSPYVVAHSSNFEIRYRLMQEKLGAVFITDLFLSTLPQISRDIYFIPLSSPLSFRTLYIRYHKNRKANEHLHKFITNIFEYCKANPKLCDYCDKYIAEYENNQKKSL